ncbi:MAG: hypothetical protein V5A55_02075 [Halovenus sp.]
MNRRTFLAGTGLAIAGLAGCLSNGEGPGTDDDGTDDSGDDGDADSVPVLTDYAVSDHVVAPDAERNSDMDAWGLFLATRDAAEGYFGAVDGSGAEAVRTFIDETAFDAGDRLLYIQAFARQTCYDLVLEGEPAVGANGLPGVRVGLDRTAPEDEPCGDAITPVDLLLRLSFDLDAGSTDVVEVQVSGSLNDPEDLLIEAER